MAGSCTHISGAKIVGRRIIPVMIALLIAVAVSIPSWSSTSYFPGWSASDANRWTLTLLAVVFVFKGAIFYWMYRLMTCAIDDTRRSLTVFGRALCDLFLSLVVFNAALSAFFGCFAWASWRMQPLESWQILTLRAALAGSATLVFGTGVGVSWEIRRSRADVSVHVPTSMTRKPMRTEPTGEVEHANP